MRKKIIRALLALGFALFIFIPIDTAFAQSPADCEAYARNEARRSGGSMLGGATRGAARGALFGAVVGDSSKSARRGAALGAVAGGARRAARKNDIYNYAYDDCMAGRVKW